MMINETNIIGHEIHNISSTTKELKMNRGILTLAALIFSGNTFATEVRERTQEQIRQNQSEQGRLREQERIRSEQLAKDQAQEHARQENSERLQEHQRQQERAFPENPSFRGGEFGSGRGHGGGGRNR